MANTRILIQKIEHGKVVEQTQLPLLDERYSLNYTYWALLTNLKDILDGGY